MKTTFLFTSLFLMCSIVFMQQAKAQTDVTISPIGLLFGDLNVGADFMLSENFSIEGNVGLNFGNNDFGTTEAKYFGLPITAFGKYYFNPREGADRFYIDAWLRFVSRNYEWEDTSAGFADYSQTRFGLGFGAGFKTVSRNGIVFDIGFGIGRALLDNTNYKDSDGQEVEVDWPELMFVGKLGVGYRFGQ